MTRFGIALSAFIVASTALANPPGEEDLTQVRQPQATATATRSSLLGDGCSYTTGIMAERVQAEGKIYSYSGPMIRQATNTLKGVAVPFAIGADKSTLVIANEFVEKLIVDGHETQKLELKGKVLEVQGTRFFLLERYDDLSL